MKRILLFTIVIGLFAVQANADLWSVTRSEALNFTTYSISGGIVLNDFGVYDGRNTLVSGDLFASSTYDGETMSGQVGFAATLRAASVGGYVTLDVSDVSPLLSSLDTYGGIGMYVQNDNQSNWAYQLYYKIGDTEYNSGDFVTVQPQDSIWLTTGALLDDLDLSDITKIGLRIQGHMTGLAPNPSTSDTMYTSVVPVPAAVILGLLGLGVAGIKLRKYA